MSNLELRGAHTFLGGEPFEIISGDMHYFRFFPGGWKRRLELMRDFGLNCVQTYVPWNSHEPEKGEFRFDGRFDLAAFVRLCDEVGLKVLLRPSPYICSEWDLGGLPYWLLRDRDLTIRSSDERYLKHVADYYDRLCSEFVPLLSTNGGPIIAVSVENEYGSFANDREYLRTVAKMLRERSVNVPLYLTSGADFKFHDWGGLPEEWNWINLHDVRPEDKDILRAFQGDKPLAIGELWAGSAMHWGGYFNRMPLEVSAEHYRHVLEEGYMVNYYMFCGGSNFGFENGAEFSIFRADVPKAKLRYLPYVTSYDVDAPVSENGNVTPKYYALKKVLCDHLAVEYTKNKPDYRAQAPGEIKMNASAPLFSQLDALCTGKFSRANVCCMEDLGQDSGFILYRTHISYTDDRECSLYLKCLHDRATVYGDGIYLGTLYRNRPGEVRFFIPKGGIQLDILVENMGRLNFGYKIGNDRKGLMQYVHIDRVNADTGEFEPDRSLVYGWEIYTLPFKTLENVAYSDLHSHSTTPAFYKGTFDAEPGIDTFIDMSAWQKGFLFVNGFNLGRYWNIGPQQTLYVPGELLQERNTVEVFELYDPAPDFALRFSAHAILDSIPSPDANYEKLT